MLTRPTLCVNLFVHLGRSFKESDKVQCVTDQFAKFHKHFSVSTRCQKNQYYYTKVLTTEKNTCTTPIRTTRTNSGSYFPVQ